MKFLLFAAVFLFACQDFSTPLVQLPQTKSFSTETDSEDPQSWKHFLRHLTVVDTLVLDYKGKPVEDQEKSAGIIPYDVGKADLQQCADAIMRLRAEFLFERKRYSEIGFHFVSGQYYSWNDYCKGLKPVPAGNRVKFIQGAGSDRSHSSLRKYLDIVYTYASTISLAKELKDADRFETGVVVIKPGSPGHCFIIIDEKEVEGKGKLFRLAEGYTPAQSIYILRNLEESGNYPWHALVPGPIETASYLFTEYKLKKFE